MSPDTADEAPRAPLKLGTKKVDVINPKLGDEDPNAVENILAANLACETASRQAEFAEDARLFRAHRRARWSRRLALLGFLAVLNGAAVAGSYYSGWNPFFTTIACAAAGTFTLLVGLYLWIR